MSGTRSRQRRERRVAGYAVYPFFRTVLDPIVGAFAQSLISGDLRELLEFRPDVIVVPEATSIPTFRDACDARNVYVVGLRHGGENKYIGPEPEYAAADFVCGSDWDLARFRKFSVMPRREFLMTGNAWVDEVFRLPQRAARRESPTILFAPTYNPETSAASVLGDRLVPLIRDVYPESRVIIKPHPVILSVSQVDDPKLSIIRHHRPLFQQWVTGWEASAREDGRVQFVTDPIISITRLFEGADILISDGSSLILEFMALDRPMLLAKSREKIGYWTYDDDAPGNSWRDMGIEFADAGEFTVALREAFERHDAIHSAKQQEYTERLHGRYRDGRSCERVVEAIRNLPWMDVVEFGGIDVGSDILIRRRANDLANAEVVASVRELETSEARYAMLVDGRSETELVRGCVVADGQRLLESNPGLCGVGRVEAGMLCADFSIHDRARLLRSGVREVVSEVDGRSPALTSSIRDEGMEFESIWNTSPCLWFGKGFYADENGARWMERRAGVELGTSVFGPWTPSVLLLRLTLGIASAEQYPAVPVQVRIVRGGGTPDVVVQFTESHETRRIELPVSLERGHARVDFESSGEFCPADRGELDTRRLAVLASRMEVVPVPEGARRVTLADGFHEANSDGCWMSQRGTIIVPASGPGQALVFSVLGGRPEWYGSGGCVLAVVVDGEQYQFPLLPSDETLQISLPVAPAAHERLVELSCSSSFVPALLGVSDDERRLGLFVVAPRLE
jgi:CDP-glycerol glycerophosphotransferase (TagB/SpsB family)